MKVLYILGAYKPKMSANGICSDNIINELKKQGHKVTVLCNHYDGLPFYENVDNLDVFRVKPKLYVQLKQYSETHSKTRKFLSKFAGVLSKIIIKLQLLLFWFLWPNVSRGTTKRFKNKALELQKQYNFDIVISAFAPVESLIAGYEIKKKYPNVKYIPYFLDSLSGGYGISFLSKKTIVRLGLKIEKKLFKLADKIVVMNSSKEHHNLYNSEFLDKMKVLDIPMLTNSNIVLNAKNKQSTTKLLFVGSIDTSIRNPDTIISILENTQNENIVCEFVGKINCINKFDNLKEKYKDRLILTGFIGHNEILQKISEADFLINIGNLITTMVPSKIFEYMSYGKPIITTYEIDNEPSQNYLSKYPLALLIDGRNSFKDNLNRFEDFIVSYKNKRVSYEDVEKLFYLNTPKAFYEDIIMKD